MAEVGEPPEPSDPTASEWLVKLAVTESSSFNPLLRRHWGAHRGLPCKPSASTGLTEVDKLLEAEDDKSANAICCEQADCCGSAHSDVCIMFTAAEPADLLMHEELCAPGAWLCERAGASGLALSGTSFRNRPALSGRRADLRGRGIFGKLGTEKRLGLQVGTRWANADAPLVAQLPLLLQLLLLPLLLSATLLLRTTETSVLGH
mmetsp:Transcript_63129/g.159812  ORF Transcript_63129/g.159812 Transcript_63129/m.159812 type:complete len:205 (-) Transcript_63129:306-920(-)